MAEWYSRADRARMAKGLPPAESSVLTSEDYQDLLRMALDEAVAASPAKDLVASASIHELAGRQLGLTEPEKGADGKATGKYAIAIDWSARMDLAAGQAGKDQSLLAQSFTSVFHEVRHVEQKAMAAGAIQPSSESDMAVATQAAVTDLYPSLYQRGYETNVLEVDADVAGLAGALAFFDSHPEIRARYGFDFRKEAMRRDEYGVLADRSGATPEDLLSGMVEYRDGVYASPWKPLKEGQALAMPTEGSGEALYMANLEEKYGVTRADLEGMDNDERNVLLLQSAIEVLDTPGLKAGPTTAMHREGSAMSYRYDMLLRDLRDAGERLPEEVFSDLDAFVDRYNAAKEANATGLSRAYDAESKTLGSVFAAATAEIPSGGRGSSSQARSSAAKSRAEEAKALFGHIMMDAMAPAGPDPGYATI